MHKGHGSIVAYNVHSMRIDFSVWKLDQGDQLSVRKGAAESVLIFLYSLANSVSGTCKNAAS